jgi:hypothetical protein
MIGVALMTPLPTPKPKRVRPVAPSMARLDIVQAADQAGHVSAGNGGSL